MKINKKLLKAFFSAGVFALAAPIVLAACVNTSKEAIAVALADPDNERWQKALTDMKTSLSEYKGSDDKAYTVKAVQSKKQEEQNLFVTSQISSYGKNLKGIVVGAIDDSASTLANEAEKSKIPFVAYDRLINKTNKYRFYATFDNAKVGELQGLWLASKLVNPTNTSYFKTVPELETWLNSNKGSLTTDKYFYPIAGSNTDNNSKIFFENAMNVLDKVTSASNGKIRAIFNSTSSAAATLNDLYDSTTTSGTTTYKHKSTLFEKVAIANWDYKTALDNMSTNFSGPLRSSLSNIKGVLAPNDGMAKSAIQAIEAANNNDFKVGSVYITGQDANDFGIKYIKDKKQGMTIYKPDSVLSKVVAGMIKQLITKYDSTGDEVLAALKTNDNTKEYAKYFKLDKTNYVPTVSSGTATPVNTIILNPLVVTNDNILTYTTEKPAENTDETTQPVANQPGATGGSGTTTGGSGNTGGGDNSSNGSNTSGTTGGSSGSGATGGSGDSNAATGGSSGSNSSNTSGSSGDSSAGSSSTGAGSGAAGSNSDSGSSGSSGSSDGASGSSDGASGSSGSQNSGSGEGSSSDAGAAGGSSSGQGSSEGGSSSGSGSSSEQSGGSAGSSAGSDSGSAGSASSGS